MGFAHRAIAAAGAGLAASAIVGCGSGTGRWLTQSESSRLSAQLNRVTLALDAGQCAAAQRYLSGFRSDLSGLSGVSATLIANLNQGASTVASLASATCQKHTQTQPKRTRPRHHRQHTQTTTTNTGTSTQTAPVITATTET